VPLSKLGVMLQPVWVYQLTSLQLGVNGLQSKLIKVVEAGQPYTVTLNRHEIIIIADI